eukprot:Skav209273  [mRNA]  locus=scaffold1552:258936:261948:- [translate_table: standard]
MWTPPRLLKKQPPSKECGARTLQLIPMLERPEWKLPAFAEALLPAAHLSSSAAESPTHVLPPAARLAAESEQMVQTATRPWWQR